MQIFGAAGSPSLTIHEMARQSMAAVVHYQSQWLQHQLELIPERHEWGIEDVMQGPRGSAWSGGSVWSGTSSAWSDEIVAQQRGSKAWSDEGQQRGMMMWQDDMRQIGAASTRGPSAISAVSDVSSGRGSVFSSSEGSATPPFPCAILPAPTAAKVSGRRYVLIKGLVAM